MLGFYHVSIPMPYLQTGFYPKLILSWRAGYDLVKFKADVLEALTVAIVALPLWMAIAMASHVAPERGLYTAIIGGFIISALGGSRFQIGWPAGAFIVLVASISDSKGLDGLFLATMMAGAILFAVGISGLGRFIRYVPHAVTVGFMAGIAVIILSSQIKDLFGLKLAGGEPAALAPKLGALVAASSSFNFMAFGIAGASVALIVALRVYRPQWPSLLIAVCLASAAALLIPGTIETIASRFGGIPSNIPMPHLPEMSGPQLLELLPSALSLALLVGIVATGTIARTATNVKEGAQSPISDMLHSVFLLLVMLVAAPLAGFIPLAALAAILTLVCWNMVDRSEIMRLFKKSPREAVVAAVTFLLTIFVDLTTGIGAGVVLVFLLSPKEFLRGPKHHHQP